MYPTRKDTNMFQSLTYALLKRDKDSALVKFNDDNTFRELNSSDSARRNYHFTKDSLFMKGDSSFNSFKFHFINDSVLTLTEKDSTAIILKKQ